MMIEMISRVWEKKKVKSKLMIRDVDNSWKVGKIPGCQRDLPG